MTQIFGIVTRKCIFHISDRLLSQKEGDKFRAFDRYSNKSIIFTATDAHVVVAYTGRAYLDHIPTDTFISQSLIGQPLSENGGFYIVGTSTWTDIGRSVERLLSCLTNAFQRLEEKDREANFQVSIIGWRQNRRNKRLFPIVWEIQRPFGKINEPFEIDRNQRWWGWDRGYTCSMIPNAPSSIVQWMRYQLREHGNKSPEEIKRVLIETLQRCVNKNPDTVGKECLEIMLTPTVSPHARIRYINDIYHPNDLSDGVCGYSPWIVNPPLATSPAKIQGVGKSGGWTNQTTGFKWVYEGPISSGRKSGFSQSSQKRPPDPQKPKRV